MIWFESARAWHNSCYRGKSDSPVAYITVLYATYNFVTLLLNSKTLMVFDSCVIKVLILLLYLRSVWSRWQYELFWKIVSITYWYTRTSWLENMFMCFCNFHRLLFSMYYGWFTFYPSVFSKTILIKYWYLFTDDVENRNLEHQHPPCPTNTTEWSPCSSSCGTGLSIRFSSDNCRVVQQTRVCMLRPCGEVVNTAVRIQ